MELSRSVIEQRIHAAIKPQLNRADALLDHYTDGLPREIWEPIALQAAADHYGRPPFPVITGSFADAINRMNDKISQIMQAAITPVFHNPNEPLPPTPDRK